jgi:hypothetical protein
MSQDELQLSSCIFFSYKKMEVILPYTEESTGLVHGTRIEDESNTIRDAFYPDVEENKAVRESLKTQDEREAHVRRKKSGRDLCPLCASVRNALKGTVILDNGFYFDKSKTSALAAAF